MLKIAILGSRGVGKTVLFRILTGGEPSPRGYFSGIGVAEVPDRRMDCLRKVIEHKKSVYPHFEIHDFDGFGKMWKEERSGEILQALLGFDLLVHVVADFGTFSLDEVDEIELRFILTDMGVIERKLKKMSKELPGKSDLEEKWLLEKILEKLKEEISISQISLTEGEKKRISGYGFLSLRPRMVFLNRDERKLFEPLSESFISSLERKGVPFVEGSLKLEHEINSLKEDERKEFEEAYGIKEPLKIRFFEGVRKTLDLIQFYTIAKGEIRAWPIKNGTTAREAAGEIHTDMEKGFIRAEVIPVETLVSLGSLTQAKEKGLLRLEGKDYVVKDGDILYIRFSV